MYWVGIRTCIFSLSKRQPTLISGEIVTFCAVFDTENIDFDLSFLFKHHSDHAQSKYIK